MKIVTTILQLIPALIAAIKAIEEAMPGQGKGEQKLAAIRGIIEVTHKEGLELWPIIAKVIGVLVGLFNRSGEFTTAKPIPE